MQYLGEFKLSSPCLLHYLWKWEQIEKIYKESYLVFYIWTVVHRMLMNTAEHVFSKPIIVLHSLLFCPFTFSEFSCVFYLGLLPMLFTYWVVFFQNGEMKALISEEGKEPSLAVFCYCFGSDEPRSPESLPVLKQASAGFPAREEWEPGLNRRAHKEGKWEPWGFSDKYYL